MGKNYYPQVVYRKTNTFSMKKKISIIYINDDLKVSSDEENSDEEISNGVQIKLTEIYFIETSASGCFYCFIDKLLNHRT